MRKAVGYAVGAALLLHRHPSLALVALAMGVLGVVDMRVGHYLTSKHTAYGRAVDAWGSARIDRHQDDERIQQMQTRLARIGRRTYWMWLASPRPPEFDVSGSVGLLLALSYGRQEPPSNRLPPYSAYDLPVRIGLPWLIGVLTAAGYLWVLREAARTDRPYWRAFLAPGWRVWWRLGVFASTLGGGPACAFALAAMRTGLEAAAVVFFYAWAALSLLLALAPFAIVSDRTGIVQAVRTSARAVVANLGTALPLVLGAGLLSTLAWLLSRFSRTGQMVTGMLQSGDWMAGTRSLTGSLAGLPLDAAVSGVVYVIAAWYSAAMLIWYEDLTRAPVPEEIPELV